MLASANQEYDQQQRLTALAVVEAQRLSTRGPTVVAASVQTYQAAAIALSLETLGSLLAEQGIDDTADAGVAPASLITDGTALAGMMSKTQSPAEFSRLVATFVTDASRTTRTVDAITRPAVTGYVRVLRPPSCGRCAILAGRFYRYSTGFQRHPRCDCGMTPSTESIGRGLTTNPMDAFEAGQITDLSKADAEAVRMGADLAQVVNVRKKAAGLTVGSSVTVRAGRLTPQACLSVAENRAAAVDLLRANGYIT